MHRDSVKSYLMRKFPPKVDSLENAYETRGFGNEIDFEKAQQISNKIIQLFIEEDMTYTDAYAMLGFIHLDLSYRAERMRL